MEIGINTYGLSKCLFDNLDGTLKKLKEAGITAIEPMIVFSENGKTPEALAAHKEAEKAKMTGGHWPVWMAGEKMELDVGWVKFVGKDCIKVIRQYKDRIRILHFKDICEEAIPETRSVCFRAVGEGSIPLKDILKEAQDMNLDKVGFVIDQDGSLGDIMRDVYAGAQNLREKA